MRGQIESHMTRYSDGTCWLKDLNWSMPNAHLYNEALSGRAKSIPR